MGHKLRIEGVADFSAIHKEVKNLNDTITNAFGKDGAKVLDEKSVMFLKRESQQVFDKMKGQLGNLRKEAEDLNTQLKLSNKVGGERAEISKKIVANLQTQVALEKDIAQLKRSQNIIETGVTPEAAAKAEAATKRKATKEQREAQKVATKEQRDADRLVAAQKKKDGLDQRKAERAAMKTMTAEQKAAFKAQRAADREAEKQKAEEDKKAKVFSMEEARRKKNQQKEEDKNESRKESMRGFTANQVVGGASRVTEQLPGGNIPGAVAGSAVSAGRGAAALGMSAPLIASFAVLAAAAGAAAVAVSRMASGFEVFKQAIPDLLALTGMERSPVTRDSKTMGIGAQLGYGANEMLDLQKQSAIALGGSTGVGKNRRSLTSGEEGNRLTNVLTAGRDLGMDPGQIIGAGNQLRATGGTDQANKQLGMILDKAITSGMDKTQASHFLASAVGLLTDIDRNGTSNTNEMLNVLSDIVTSNRMSPEQAAKTMSGMQEAISGSSGEQNSFFQTAAADAGLGGGSILGTVMAVRQGLKGVDKKKLGDQVGDTKMGQMGMSAISSMGLDDEQFGSKFAGSILENIKGRFDLNDDDGKTAALGFTGQMFGAKTADEATKMLALLEKMSKPGGTSLSKDDKKLLEKMTTDPNDKWREQTIGKLDQIAIATVATAARANNAQFELGKTSAEYMNKLTDALTKLDQSINKMVAAPETKGTFDGVGQFFTNMMDGIKSMPDLFKDLLGDPLKFGEALGQTFVSIVGDGLKWLWDGLKSLCEIIASVGEGIAGLLKAIPGSAVGFVKGAFNGIMGGDEEEPKGKGWKPGQPIPGLAEAMAARGTPPGAANEMAKSPAGQPVRANGVAAAAAAPAGAAAQAAADVSPMVEEQRRTNALLEKGLRGGSAPRVAPQSNRPK